MHVIESGNGAAALGVKLCRAGVIAAYPITPQTPVTEKLSEYVEAGELNAQYIPVESEHSALAVCIAASSAGARVFTATSANGLLYMHEQVQWAAGARLPIVMGVVNRAVGAPWNVWNDQQDSISQRDTGWIQMYCADHQQIMDSVIKAYWLAEKVSIPIMVCYDGYILSHTYMPFDLPEQEKVDAFLPPFRPDYVLCPEEPANLNTVTLPDVRLDVHGELAHGYMEIRYLLHEEHEKISAERRRGGKKICRNFRTQRRSVSGSLPLRRRRLRGGGTGFHHLPASRLRRCTAPGRHPRGRHGCSSLPSVSGPGCCSCPEREKAVAVFEKALSYGYEGALYSDLKSALYDHLAGTGKLPFVRNFIAGIGGREIRTDDLTRALEQVTRDRTDAHPAWIGLKL